MVSEISKDAAEAFLAGREYSKEDTDVIVWGSNIYLTINKVPIAKRKIGKDYFEIWVCGNTTALDRLNALPGVQLKIVKGRLNCNGKIYPHCMPNILINYQRVNFNKLKQILEE